MGDVIEQIDAPAKALALAEGDWLVLASDGVESCAVADIARIAAAAGSSAAFVTDVLHAIEALHRTSQDNATLVAMRVAGAGAQEADTVQPIGRTPVEEPPTR
jgi:PPM family protein phosphatase